MRKLFKALLDLPILPELIAIAIIFGGAAYFSGEAIYRALTQ